MKKSSALLSLLVKNKLTATRNFCRYSSSVNFTFLVSPNLDQQCHCATFFLILCLSNYEIQREIEVSKRQRREVEELPPSLSLYHQKELLNSVCGG